MTLGLIGALHELGSVRFRDELVVFSTETVFKSWRPDSNFEYLPPTGLSPKGAGRMSWRFFKTFEQTVVHTHRCYYI